MNNLKLKQRHNDSFFVLNNNDTLFDDKKDFHYMNLDGEDIKVESVHLPKSIQSKQIGSTSMGCVHLKNGTTALVSIDKTSEDNYLCSVISTVSGKQKCFNIMKISEGIGNNKRLDMMKFSIK